MREVRVRYLGISYIGNYSMDTHTHTHTHTHTTHTTHTHTHYIISRRRANSSKQVVKVIIHTIKKHRIPPPPFGCMKQKGIQSSPSHASPENKERRVSMISFLLARALQCRIQLTPKISLLDAFAVGNLLVYSSLSPAHRPSKGADISDLTITQSCRSNLKSDSSRTPAAAAALATGLLHVLLLLRQTSTLLSCTPADSAPRHPSDPCRRASPRACAGSRARRPSCGGRRPSSRSA